MTTTIFKYFILILVAFHLCSCNNARTRYKAANEKVDKFFSWLEQGSVDSVFTLFSKNTFTHTESDSIRFRDALLQLNKKGKVVSKRNYSTIQKREHWNGTKITYTHVKYIVSYKDSSVFHFSFVFVKDKNNEDNIISYNSTKI